MKIIKNKKRQKLSDSNLGLSLTEPYYVDRKVRSPILSSPRCLSPDKLAGIPHSFTTCMSFNKINKQKMNKHNIKSLEPSPRATHSRITIEWDLANTQQFKQKLKQLLNQYYEIVEQQKRDLCNKVQTQRLSQIAKISVAIQQVLKNNKLLYATIKHECQNPKQSIIYQGHQEQLNQKQLLNQQNIKFLQNFTKKFIENSENSECDSKKKLDIQQKIEKLFSREILKNPNLMRSLRQFSHNYGFRQGKSFGNSTFSTFSHKTQIKNPMQSIESAKRFINSFKSRKNWENKITEKNSSDSSSESSSFEFTQAEQKQNKKLEQKLGSSDSGSDKFYHIIKQLLVRKKQEQSQEGNTGNRRKGLVAQLSEFDQQTYKKQKSNIIQSDIQLKQNKNAFLSSTFSNSQDFNRFLHEKNNTKIIQTKPKEKNGQNQKKLTFIGKKQKTNKKATIISKSNSKKNNKQESGRKPQLKKALNGSQEKKNKSKEQPLKQNKQKSAEKSKSKPYRIGLNYAKFIGKIMKANDGQKINIHLQKFKAMRRFNTRQAFLKKNKNKFKIEEDDQDQFPTIEQEKGKQVDDNFENQSSGSQSGVSDSEKKCRMTKYEEARLMYNMRNVKTRQLTINLNMTNNSSGDDMIHRRKRPSFYTKYLIPEQQGSGISKSKRGSFTRKKNDDVEQQFLSLDKFSNNLNMKQLSKTKLSSQSKQVQSEQLQLTNLNSFEQFDLQAVKSNITSFLRKFMLKNEKAKELYNFLMYMQQSRKITLEQQQINSSLDQLKIQKQQDQIKSVIDTLNPVLQQYEGCNNLYDYYSWNQRELYMANKKFFDKLDSRAIELMYWNNEQAGKIIEDLQQCSLKQIRDIPIKNA